MEDLLFQREGYVFSCRVAGVPVQAGKVLLQRHKGDYALVGGHVNALETAADALRREFMEELGAAVEVGPLLAVGELFFPWGEKPCHQLGLFCRVELTDPGRMPWEGSLRGTDRLGRERVDLEYVWVPLEEVEKIPLYPPQMKAVILGETRDVLHFVYRESVLESAAGGSSAEEMG